MTEEEKTISQEATMEVKPEEKVSLFARITRKQLLIFAAAVLGAAVLLGVGILIGLSGRNRTSAEEPAAAAEVTQSETEAATETQPVYFDVPTEALVPVTVPTETAPPETTEPTQPAAMSNDQAMLAVLENTLPVRTDSGSSMYLSNYLAANDYADIVSWRYVDFDLDGNDELFMVIDSPWITYLVIHWTGENACCFPFGPRSVTELKSNGSMSGSNGAASTSYYRIYFLGNEVFSYTLANIEFDSRTFQVNGSYVSWKEAREFLVDWYYLPNIIGSSAYPPDQCPICYEICYGEYCDYCGAMPCSNCGEWSTNGDMCISCEEDAIVYDYCYGCGNWMLDIENGFCHYCGISLCYGCGQWSYDVYDGLCDTCWQMENLEDDLNDFIENFH